MKNLILTITAILMLTGPAASQWYGSPRQQQLQQYQWQQNYNQQQMLQEQREQNRIQQEMLNQQRQQYWLQQQQQYQPATPFGSFWQGFQRGRGR